ncbi:unnamed protein product [Urochloa humidicola]
MGDDTIIAADFKSSMDKLFAELSSVRSEVTTIKGDQSRLSVAVNRLQSDKHKAESSGGASDKESLAIARTSSSTNLRRRHQTLRHLPTNSASSSMTAPKISSDGSTSASSSSAHTANRRTRRC